MISVASPMGLFDKIREKSRGVVTSARPAHGVAPQPAAEVRRRLLAISGRGIQTAENDGQVVVSWSAKVASARPGGAGYEHLYRAIRVDLDEEEFEATGLCLKTTTVGKLGLDATFSGSKEWERGQHIGTETLHILAWLGPHDTEGAADEKGYRFSWSDLRKPVIEAVTGAGWSYKPKKI